MFCPNCGQEAAAGAMKFCSRCGYLLTGTAELMKLGGVLGEELTQKPSKQSAKARGVKIGIFMMLAAVVLVPFFGIVVRFMLGMPNPWPIGLILFLLGGGGLLRIAYAILFEEGAKAQALQAPYRTPELHVGSQRGELPPQQTYPVTDYTAPGTGRWRDTNDLDPVSVTESTTKLLEKDSEQ